MNDDLEINGPLELWPFPLLNTLIKLNSDDGGSGDDSKVETAKFVRDSNGEVQEIVVIKE